MQHWAIDFFHQVPRFVGVLMLYPTCYKIFAWLEDRLSSQAKQEITAWLNHAGGIVAQHSLSFNLLRFHCTLFGNRQFSVKCFRRTIVFSITSFCIVFFPNMIAYLLYTPGIAVIVYGTKIHDNALVLLIELLFAVFVFVVFPLDFLGVGVTRMLSSLVGNSSSIKTVSLVLIIDTIIKSVVFPILVFLSVIAAVVIGLSIIFNTSLSVSWYVTYFIYEYVLQLISVNNISIKQFFSAYVSIIPLFMMFPSIILCSAWVWLYFVGLHIVRATIFLFDVEKQPVRSIGVVAAALLVTCGALYTMAVGGYASEGLQFGSSIYAGTGDYNLAIRNLDEAIRLKPTSPSLFADRGYMYSEKSDFERAITDYNKAIELDPKSAKAFIGRGYVFSRMQDFERAMADYAEAVKLDSNAHMTFYYRGFINEARGDLDHAIVFYNEAIRLNPKADSVLSSRGGVKHKQRDYDGAIADYDEALRLNPANEAAFNGRGDAYSAKQDYDRAIGDYNEAIRLFPKYVVAYNGRGQAYSSKQEYTNAVADYSEVIRLYPNFRDVFINRGRAYIGLQDYGRAVADYTEAIRLDPSSAIAFRRRGIAYALEQDYDRAIGSLNQAIRLDQDSAGAILFLYHARVRSGAQTAATELDANVKNMKHPNWYPALVEVFIGNKTPGDTLAFLSNSVDLCIAQFHIGAWYSSRAERAAAIEVLKVALDICPKTLIEYDVARAELQQLRP